MVFFEAPHRTGPLLSAMADAFGADRPAAVCRELTKTYEEVRRGPARRARRLGGRGRPRRGDHRRRRCDRPRHPESPIPIACGPRSPALVEEGLRRKDAIAAVARPTAIPKREVYQVVHG